MSEESDALLAPKRRGHGNAIVTYEKVAAIETSLALLLQKVDTLVERFTRMDAQTVDHETRLRAIELSLSAITAGGKTKSDTWLFVWSAVVSIASLGLGAIGIVFK